MTYINCCMLLPVFISIFTHREIEKSPLNSSEFIYSFASNMWVLNMIFLCFSYGWTVTALHFQSWCAEVCFRRSIVHMLSILQTLIRVIKFVFSMSATTRFMNIEYIRWYRLISKMLEHRKQPFSMMFFDGLLCQNVHSFHYYWMIF